MKAPSKRHLPSGLYTPMSHSREVFAPEGQSTVLARLTSYHEAMHAFLNSSTSFGCAMIWAGALSDAGYPAFTGMVGRMIAASTRTHEMLATVSALCTATGGSLDRTLLDQYAGYLTYLDGFLATFGSDARPFIATVALTSCARAAMQTDIMEGLLERPCGEWPKLIVDGRKAPDVRFAAALTPEHANGAMEAVDAVLVLAGPAGRMIAAGVSPEREHELLVGLGPDAQDGASAAAFRIFASALADAGFGRPSYDGHKSGASEVSMKVKAYAGTRLAQGFVAPTGPAEDIKAVWLEFRRERLVVRPTKDAAVLLDAVDGYPGAASGFVLDNGQVSYLQFVSMPIEKVVSLYSILHGRACLDRWPVPTFTAFRRRWVDEDLGARVEFYLLGTTELECIMRVREGVEVLAVVSLATLLSTDWRDLWVRPEIFGLGRVAVLIDTDPFALLARKNRPTRAAVLKAKLDADSTEHAEVFCMTFDDDPTFLYFTPCTTPFKQAILQFARMRRLDLVVDPCLAEEWQDVLERLLGHVLREEHRFGVEFWPKVEGL